MKYKKAKFVIHYRDGQTYVENRNDPYSWDNRPIKPISALGILQDPIPIDKTDLETGRKIRVTPNEHTLKGSFKKQFGFFQYKHASLIMQSGQKGKTHALTVGMVVNKKGDCVCMTIRHGSVYTYFADVHSLTLNLELFGIKLEELPD